MLYEKYRNAIHIPQFLPTNPAFTITVTRENEWYVAKYLENNVASQGRAMDEVINCLREAVELFYEEEQLPLFLQTFVTTLEVAL